MADEFDKIMKLIETEDKYIRTWEDHRKTANNELLKEDKNRLLKQIEMIDKKSKTENLCMTEARLWLSNSTTMLNQHDRIWGKIYDKDVGAMDIDILTLEQEENYLDNSNEQLQLHEHESQIKINEFEERKREREEKMNLKILHIAMATKIQAFWRGVMVRKCLGKYKRLKKIFKKKSTKKTKKAIKKR